MPNADVRALDRAYAPPAGAPEHAVPVDGRPACPECRAPVAGRFCERRSEARPAPGRLRRRQIVGELVDHHTNRDYRVPRTLTTHPREPAALTVAVIAWRRNRYTRPLSLHVLVSDARFLRSPHMPDELYDPRALITASSPGSRIGRQVETAAARRVQTRTHMAVRVRQLPRTTPRTTAALLAPVLAAPATLLLAGRGRLVAEQVLSAAHL